MWRMNTKAKGNKIIESQVQIYGVTKERRWLVESESKINCTFALRFRFVVLGHSSSKPGQAGRSGSVLVLQNNNITWPHFSLLPWIWNYCHFRFQTLRLDGYLEYLSPLHLTLPVPVPSRPNHILTNYFPPIQPTHSMVLFYFSTQLNWSCSFSTSFQQHL